MNISKTDLLGAVKKTTHAVQELKFPDIGKIAEGYQTDYTVLSGIDGNDTQTMKDNSLGTFNKWKKMKSYANIGMVIVGALGVATIIFPSFNAVKSYLSKPSLEAIQLTGIGLAFTSLLGGITVDSNFTHKANDAGKQYNTVNKWENFASQLLTPQRELTFDC